MGFNNKNNNSSNVGEQARSHSKIPWLALALIFFLGTLVLGIGATFAALSDSQTHNNLDGYAEGKLINKGDAIGEVDAYPGVTVNRTAIAKNEGKQVMYTRMKIEKKWVQKDNSGKWVDVDSKDTDLSLNEIEVVLDDTTKWKDGGDGYYYYSDAINAGEQTTSLLKAVKLSEDIGQEQNDNKYHDSSTSSKYVGKAAKVYVTMECTAEPIIHTVKVNTNGGTQIDDIVVEDGKIVQRPSDPVRDGYTFGGWYADEACTVPFDFDAPVKGDLTLYAKWTKNEDPVEPDDPTPTPTDNTQPTQIVFPTYKVSEATSDGTTELVDATPSELVDTGDGLSNLTITLFALAVASFAGCLIAFFFASRRNRQDEEE
jgi:alternate signal-mediated exported protein